MAVLLVVFTLQNQEKVGVRLFFWNVKNIPLALLIIICLLLGYLIPYISLLSRVWRLKKELKQTREEVDELREGLEEARASGEKPDPEGIELDSPDDGPDPQVERQGLARRFFRD